MKRIACFTGGEKIPSARFRVRQYIPKLMDFSLDLKEFKTKTTSYPPANKILRPFWGALRIIESIPLVLESKKYDAVLLQREIISTYSTLEKFVGKPRIFDVDDSIHLYRNGAAARSLAGCVDRVICGNNYLADVYSQWNKNVFVLPTAIDCEVYLPAEKVIGSDKTNIILGWIGTPGNFSFLEYIEDSLVKVFNSYPSAKLHVVSSIPPVFKRLNKKNWFFTKWTENLEVNNIQSFDIGLMPLIDSEWARGKCSFKMLQYMACGIPVVVSAVGMNNDVLKNGHLGFGVNNSSDWYDSLSSLIENEQLREEMGDAGRFVAVDKYSLEKLSPVFASFLN